MSGEQARIERAVVPAVTLHDLVATYPNDRMDIEADRYGIKLACGGGNDSGGTARRA